VLESQHLWNVKKKKEKSEIEIQRLRTARCFKLKGERGDTIIHHERATESRKEKRLFQSRRKGKGGVGEAS